MEKGMGTKGGHFLRTLGVVVDFLLLPLAEGEDRQENLVRATRGCSRRHPNPSPTATGLADILLSASLAAFLCPGDIPSPVTALRCGGPIQRGSPGAAEDHQPETATAGVAGLPLPPA